MGFLLVYLGIESESQDLICMVTKTVMSSNCSSIEPFGISRDKEVIGGNDE